MSTTERWIPGEKHQSDVSPGEQHKVNSSYLLNGENEVSIAHGVDEYRLRNTREGKSILTT